ncbi:Helix-turn-helix domain-containing protein [Spirosomataceae bacterium TFI 002]|nr:Helix-turn-helix domain-containing protein [Spirosomataceae bacterium TFI 002]
MKHFNFNAKDPTTFWKNILQHHEVSSTLNEFDLNEKLGFGHYRYKKIASNIQYIQFHIKLNEPILYNFKVSEYAKNYKLILFHKGSSKSVRFLNIDAKENFEKNVFQIDKFENERTTHSCHLLSQFSDVPDFVIEKDEICTFHLLFLEQDWLNELLPDNINLNFYKPVYNKDATSEIIGLNRVVCFDKLFNTLNTFRDNLHDNKLDKLADLFKILGDYFFVVKFLKDSPALKSANIDVKDFKKLILIERKLNQIIYSSPPSLKTLSEEFGICKTKMCLDFKEFYGKGILGYYNDLKLNAAKELLTSSRDNMKEISDTLSFSSQSNFNKWFKKNTGTTPRLFRTSPKLNYSFTT